MPSFPGVSILAVAAVVSCAGLAGCGGEPDDPRSQLSGTVDVDGSSTVFPLSEAAAEEFRKKYPNVRIPVGESGTGGGFKRFVIGETDISDASRPIKADEIESAEAKGIEFIELPIAYDGLTIVVHPENDWVDELTVEQLRTIFLADSAPRTWKAADENWPDVPLKVYSPGADSGTFDYFKEVVIQDEQTEEFRNDPNVSFSEDDNELVRGVSGDRGAIGFFGASYYFNNREQLKALRIVNPETNVPVAPTPETIESGEYAPFSRPLFIYVNAESAREPQVDRFVKFYLENAGRLAEKVDYVALPDAISGRVRTHYEKALTGTHFLTADGEKRSGSLDEIYKAETLPARDGK
jgi:phosphate transport system substrate-binding protein